MSGNTSRKRRPWRRGGTAAAGAAAAMLIGGAVVAGIASGGGTQTAGGGRAVLGPFALLTLPSLGDVTWYCAAGPHGRDAWSLAIRIDPRSATTRVRFAASGVRRPVRVLQPGERARFPTVPARRQSLALVQAIKPGTLRASLRVEFQRARVASNCQPYLPPRIDLHIEPRGAS